MTEAENCSSGFERDRQYIREAKAKGAVATLGAYTKLSGPGWLQSAITLGGGSLSSALYLGVLGGFSLLWLQPLAMFVGVIMLSAISYVTLSTGERPFRAINQHINPVLGWGWALASLAANLVWSLPQFSLGCATLQQNLIPSLVGAEVMPGNVGKFVACGGILAVCVAIVWFYDTGSKGIRVFEGILKVMVGVIIICFVGVVVKMALTPDALDVGGVLRGFIPDVRSLWAPAHTFTPYLEEVDKAFRGFWSDMIVGQQRNVMIAATATAVGINMTFLLPYSMLKRGWDKDFRGLAVFDLFTGLLVPFVVATGCVVVAAAAQFHARPIEGILEGDGSVEVPAKLRGEYESNAKKRIGAEMGAEAFNALSPEEQQRRIEALPLADRRMAAIMVRRDVFNLAQSLRPLTGDVIAQYIFGIGVLAMAISTIIILMLINGFVVCEMLGVESSGWPHRLGSLLPCIGVLGPFLWKHAAPLLAVPTSVFGMMLIPIAYISFFLLMNQKSLLGENLPRGGKRILWNVAMIAATGLVSFGSFWSVWDKAHWKGVMGVAALVVLALVVHVARAGGRQAATYGSK